MTDKKTMIEKCPTCGKVNNNYQWELGLRLLQIKKKYGVDQLGKISEETGITKSTLESFRWTVKKYLENDPNFLPTLPISFYRIVATLPFQQRENLLQRATEEKFSVARLELEKKRITHPSLLKQIKNIFNK